MVEDAVAIGIDVGGTGTKAGLVTATGEVIERFEHPTDPTAGTKGTVAIAGEALAWARDKGLDVAAAGVGAAGFIEFATGTVTFSPNLTYDDPKLGDALRGTLSVPVAVDNDANAAAWGERSFGSARGADDLVVLTIGTGIGSGIVVGGRLLRGSTGTGAEAGHTVVAAGGPRCQCGLRGCLEQMASGQAIERMAREATQEDPGSRILELAGAPELIMGEDVARAAREMDETARSVLKNAGRFLGIGLSNMANLFDPEAVVLAGSVVEAGEAYLGPARDTIAEMTSAQRRRPLRVDVSELGNDIGIVGAAALAFDQAR